MESNEFEEILARYERIQVKTEKLKQENNELKKKFALLNSKVLKSQSVRNELNGSINSHNFSWNQ